MKFPVLMGLTLSQLREYIKLSVKFHNKILLNSTIHSINYISLIESFLHSGLGYLVEAITIGGIIYTFIKGNSVTITSNDSYFDGLEEVMYREYKIIVKLAVNPRRKRIRLLDLEAEPKNVEIGATAIGPVDTIIPLTEIECKEYTKDTTAIKTMWLKDRRYLKIRKIRELIVYVKFDAEGYLDRISCSFEKNKIIISNANTIPAKSTRIRLPAGFDANKLSIGGLVDEVYQENGDYFMVVSEIRGTHNNGGTTVVHF